MLDHALVTCVCHEHEARLSRDLPRWRSSYVREDGKPALLVSELGV
jgi:hypothetical protein